MNREYLLRPMRKEDWNRVCEMELEIFEEDKMRKDQFLNRVERGNFWALEVDGSVIGELAITRFGKFGARIGRIGVAKSHQRKGWGKVLMNKAIEWFRNEGDITSTHLYTQDYNIAAQSLYKKFGFNISGITWHYIVPFASLRPEGKYTCQEISDAEIDFVGEKFSGLPAAQIRRFLEDEKTKYYVLILKDSNGNIVGAARFTPSFPGSFPFEITSVDCFDDFMRGMEKLSLPELDYVRTVFTDNEELFELCGVRDYHLHHKLLKMTLQL